MRLTSYGAARTVTGSKHLLEVNGHRILFDCGMFQGVRRDAETRNRFLPFAPDRLDVVVLSHAHIDHSGVIPMLTKQGYRGRIYSTCATRDLCALMLLDSAHIQKRDAEWLSKKSRAFVAPLYDENDVRTAMQRFVCVPYGESFEIAPDVTCTLHDAGHVLGSAMAMVEFQDNGARRRLLYGGDLGRKNMPILNDPWVPGEADVVLLEGTYGNRDHDPIEQMDQKLAEIVQRACAQGGKILVPSFALERTQEIVYALKRLETAKAIPSIPVFVDSPLSTNITEVFRQHTECFDAEIQRLMQEAGDPFELQNIRYIRNVEESMRLNALKGPAIIISASGMCEQGRILHHLRNHAGNPDNFILIVGFQAKNTLGRRIVERAREIKIFGINRPLNAEVKVMNGFSAHAGRSELIDFGLRFKDCAAKVVLVHGEDEALEALEGALKDRGMTNVMIQEEGKPFEL